MPNTVKPIPDGFHTVTPYMVMKNASAALEFYKKAFGAAVLVVMPGPGGKVMHAEIQIGDCRVMLAEEVSEMGYRGPETLGGSSVSLCLYVEDVDAAAQRALDAGAKVLRPVQDQFYGDRTGTFVDPFGHVWTIMTHKEDVSPDEMRSRMAKMMPKQG